MSGGVMSNRWVIFGAGGLGREVYSYISKYLGDEVVGFVAPGGGHGSIPVRLASTFGELMNGFPRYRSRRAICVIAVGNPQLRSKIGEEIQDLYTEPLLIGDVGTGVSMRAGAVVCPRALVTADAYIGHHAYLNVGALVAHGASVGGYSVLNPYCQVLGDARVGDRVMVGAAAVVLPKVQVGDDAVIGAGAVVVRDVRPGDTVVGVPARPV